MWVLFVIIGGAVNAILNFGYKKMGAVIGAPSVVAIVMGLGAIIISMYAILMGIHMGAVTNPKILLAILLMGAGTSLTWIIMVTALRRGPISLADPMWACLYALVSVLIGMGLAHETPKMISLMGVGLYLVGAFLMARDAKNTVNK